MTRKFLPLFVALTLAFLAALTMTFTSRPVHASSTSPTIKTIQVTIGASTTQVTTTDIFCRQIFFQNNAAHNMRVGDSTTSSSKGVQLNFVAGGGGGSWTVTTIYGNTLDLADWWVNGTNADVLDIACTQ